MIQIKTANRTGWMEGDNGDGIVLNFKGRARGTVRYGQSPTLQTDGGGELGSNYDEQRKYDDTQTDGDRVPPPHGIQ